MNAPDDYADLLDSQPTRYTAPPAPHGVRDPLWALAATPLLGALLDWLF